MTQPPEYTPPEEMKKYEVWNNPILDDPEFAQDVVLAFKAFEEQSE